MNRNLLGAIPEPEYVIYVTVILNLFVLNSHMISLTNDITAMHWYDVEYIFGLWNRLSQYFCSYIAQTILRLADFLRSNSTW